MRNRLLPELGLTSSYQIIAALPPQGNWFHRPKGKWKNWEIEKFQATQILSENNYERGLSFSASRDNPGNRQEPTSDTWRRWSGNPVQRFESISEELALLVAGSQPLTSPTPCYSASKLRGRRSPARMVHLRVSTRFKFEMQKRVAIATFFCHPSPHEFYQEFLNGERGFLFQKLSHGYPSHKIKAVVWFKGIW